MILYLFSNGNMKNHPLLLKLLPANNQANIRSFLGGVIVYWIVYIILFSHLFKFELMELEKYFWAVVTIDILFTYAYLYQTTGHNKENVSETPLEKRLNSILKKSNNTAISSKHVKFERVPEEETEIDTGDSEFDLTEFKNSL